MNTKGKNTLCMTVLAAVLTLPAALPAQSRSTYDNTDENWKVVKEREKAERKIAHERSKAEAKDARDRGREARQDGTYDDDYNDNWRRDRYDDDYYRDRDRYSDNDRYRDDRWRDRDDDDWRRDRDYNDRYGDRRGTYDNDDNWRRDRDVYYGDRDRWDNDRDRWDNDRDRWDHAVTYVSDTTLNDIQQSILRLNNISTTLQQGGATSHANRVDAVADSLQQVIDRHEGRYIGTPNAGTTYRLPADLTALLSNGSERLEVIADDLEKMGAVNTPPALNDVAEDLEEILAENNVIIDDNDDDEVSSDRVVSYNALVQVKKASSRLHEIADALDQRNDTVEANSARDVATELSDLINDYKETAVRDNATTDYQVPVEVRSRIRSNTEDLRELASEFQQDGDTRAVNAIDEVVRALDQVAGQSTTAAIDDETRARRNVVDTIIGWF